MPDFRMRLPASHRSSHSATVRLPTSQTEIGLHAPDTEGPTERDPVLAATDLGRADVERRRFLTVAAFTTAGTAMPLAHDDEATARMLRARTGTSVVGAEDVDVVRQITTAFGAADERLGGGHGLTTVTAYLADTAAPHAPRPFRK